MCQIIVVPAGRRIAGASTVICVNSGVALRGYQDFSGDGNGGGGPSANAPPRRVPLFITPGAKVETIPAASIRLSYPQSDLFEACRCGVFEADDIARSSTASFDDDCRSACARIDPLAGACP
jgi:hypothetical protein